MHFSIPDTQEFYSNNSNFTGYNIHLNGTFHCCLRYKQLHSFHDQLKRSLATFLLPQFPPKKILPLTPNQIEERRASLERYLQLVGQDPVFSKSELLRIFLLNAQQESSVTESTEIYLDVYLMNGYRISIKCFSTECSSKILEKACESINLPKEYTYYFALFLMRKEKTGDISIVKKLADYEAPYITQKLLDRCTIVIRKCYWDPSYDLQLMQDTVALNLLFINVASDIERNWITTTQNVKEQLLNLQERGNKKEFLDITRSLPTYGCIQFSNVIVDYPEKNECATILIGNKELCIRVRNMGTGTIQDHKFKVTRMKCWRVSTNYNNEESASNSSSDSSQNNNFEFSFEYLMVKNTLKWITIVSEHAMCITLSVQSMVDELLNQKDGIDLNNTQVNHTSNTRLSYIRRDGRISESNSTDTLSSLNELDSSLHSDSPGNKNKRRKFSTTVFFKNGRDSVQNEAFEGIGDDDL